MFNADAMGPSFQRSSEGRHSKPVYQPAMVSLESRIALSGMGACRGTAPANAALATELVQGLTARTIQNVDRIVSYGLGYSTTLKPGLTQGTIGSALRNEVQIRKLVAAVEERVSPSDPDYAEFRTADTYFHTLDTYLVQVSSYGSNYLRQYR